MEGNQRSTEPGRKREWWFYCMAAAFVPAAIAFVAPPVAQRLLIAAAGILMVTGLALLIAKGPSEPGKL